MTQPSYLQQVSFLGQPVNPGVNPVMAAVLQAVEADLTNTWTGQGSPGDFPTWAGLVEPSIGWRSMAGFHGSGSAVDLNVSLCPYIVTRTGSTLGGEAAAAGQTDMRQSAVNVYDRAVAFVQGVGRTADVSYRVNDTIDVAYDRFREVSDDIASYLSFAFLTSPVAVNRGPIPGVEALPDGDPAFGQISSGELNDQSAALDQIRQQFADPGWTSNHANWPYTTAEQQYWRMLRDYEEVRTPMLFGNPTQPITKTRNPAHGFLQLRKELVVSMITVGGQALSQQLSNLNLPDSKMRWGACDFGPTQSGDIMHFDLGTHAGFSPQ